MKIILLLLTIASIPFSLRKVLNPNFMGGSFNEYLDSSIFLFEVFLMLYILYSILENKNLLLSIYRERMFHVEHSIIIFVLFFLSTLYSSISSNNFWQSFFILKYAIYVLGVVFIYRDISNIVPRGTIVIKNFKICSTWNNLFKQNPRNVPRGTFYSTISPILFHVEQLTQKHTKICSTWNILQIVMFTSVILQVSVAFLQIIYQKSLGLVILGEQTISPSISGVATIIFNNNELLRGYGTFLHPNIFAASIALFSIIYYVQYIVPRGTLLRKDIFFFLTVYLGIIFSGSKSVGILYLILLIAVYSKKCSTWNKNEKNIAKNVPRGTYKEL